jgi:hypothetical protein
MNKYLVSIPAQTHIIAEWLLPQKSDIPLKYEVTQIDKFSHGDPVLLCDGEEAAFLAPSLDYSRAICVGKSGTAFYAPWSEINLLTETEEDEES